MINFKRYVLKNGLKVLLHKNPTTNITAVNLLYDVGARDENPNRTGFAHLFEHLMFGGTKNVKNFDFVLQKAGGDNNAFTTNDITNYHITIPKQNLEIALFLEADRMNELAFSHKRLNVQRNVVIEEFKQRYFNKPYADVSLFLRPLAYKVHPYQWSTIGKEIRHIAEAKLNEVKEFFYNYYVPNNAILVVSGNISHDKSIKQIEKYFANIPVRDVPKRNLPQEPVQTEKRTLTLERKVPSDAIFMAYHMCGRNDKEYHATDLISDLLSNGKSSLFERILVKEKKIFSEIDAYIQGSLDPGLLLINGKLLPGIDFDTAESEIKNVLNIIKTGNFDERELQKVKNKSYSNTLFQLSENLNLATELAFHELVFGAEKINDIEQKIMNVSRNQIIEISNNIFNDKNLSVIYYKSEK